MKISLLAFVFFLLAHANLTNDSGLIRKEQNSDQQPFNPTFSDTVQLKISPNNFLKIKDPYFNGHLFKSEDGINWDKLNLGILLENFDSVVKMDSTTTNKIAYQIMPSGMLQTNDSCIFLIGTKSTYDSQGIILKSNNLGRTWKPTVHPVTSTRMSPHDLVFLSPKVALAFFGVNQSEYIQYGLSLDAGESWEFLRTKTKSIEIKKRKIRLEVQLDLKGQLIRKIQGKLSTDKGTNFNPINLNHQ